jgi:benzoyl-CoA 2,3-dioxygenase component A
MRDAAPQLAALLQDPQTHFYVCGLKAMEEGVLQALQDIAQGARLDWAAVEAGLKQEGRLQLETY